MNKKIKIEIAVGIIVLLALMSGLYIWKSSREIQFGGPGSMPTQEYINRNKTACTMEAKLCADGTYVSRTGQNCEFAACQEIKKDETADWQTYKNDKYGFKIKYPNNFTQNVSSEKNTFLYLSGKDGHISVGLNEDDSVTNYTHLYTSTPEAKEIKIQGRSAYEYFFQEGASYTGVVVIQLGKDVLEIVYDATGGQQSLIRDTINKMISALEFTQE